MKYIHLNALFLVFVFHTSCGQNQTNPPQDNISKGIYAEAQIKEAGTSKVPMSMVRHVKKARNGDILIASSLGVFRYDGTSFANISSKISSPRFSSFWMFWKIEKEIFGSLPEFQVFIVTMGNPFSILQQMMGLPIMGLKKFTKIKPVIFGSRLEVEQAVTMGNLFEILQRKTDFPITILILLWKTKHLDFKKIK